MALSPETEKAPALVGGVVANAPRPRRLAVLTWGCQMNADETDHLLDLHTHDYYLDETLTYSPSPALATAGGV